MNEKDPKEEKKVNEEDAADVVGGTDMGTELENNDEIPAFETPSWEDTSTPIIYSVYDPSYPQPYIEPPSPYYYIKDD